MISVIVANYNHARWLPRALTALASQEFRPAEIIVVDDGSTDNSVEIIERLQVRFANIRMMRHEQNRGFIEAARTGVQAATGEFLLFAAADDFVLPGLFASAASALMKHPEAAFFCAEAVLIDQGGRVQGFRPFTVPSTHSGFVSPERTRKGILRSDNWFIGPTVIYRRDRVAEVGFFDEELGSLCDAMTNRMLALRYGFYFQAETLAAWMIHPHSMSAQSSLSTTASERLFRVAERWMASHFPPEMHASYSSLFIRRLRFAMARLKIVWSNGKIDADSICDTLEWGRFDRVVVKTISFAPWLSSKLILAWMTLRVRPYGLVTIARAWWRNVTVNRSRRATLERAIAEANAVIK